MEEQPRMFKISLLLVIREADKKEPFQDLLLFEPSFSRLTLPLVFIQGDQSLAVAEPLPILGPGCWPFSSALRSGRAARR